MTGQLDVWVQGRFAGVLDDHDGDVAFSYDTSYRNDRYAPALSVSMPKVWVRHGDNVARRWIGNLLPDNDDVRERWARRFGERRATSFNLLRHMGQDCAGAVQVMPAGQSPGDVKGVSALSPAEIEERLRVLRVDDSQWTFGDHGGRWSLGGAQGKFALTRLPDGTWSEPTGRSASTHIFKVGVHRLEHSDVAEYVTTRVAALIGLPVAHAEIVRFGDQTALITQRYDRRISPDGTVHRLHQEDLCQALGLSRAAKYESDGGPGVGQVAELITSAVDPRDRPAARREFFAALVFNWAVAGTDAHAKNYSLIHTGPRVSMAPLYDLTSAAALVTAREIEFESRLAMKLGGHYKLRDIHARHLVRAAEQLSIDADEAMRTAGDLVAALPEAMAAALAEIADIAPADVEQKIRTGLWARADAAARTLAG